VPAAPSPSPLSAGRSPPASPAPVSILRSPTAAPAAAGAGGCDDSRARLSPRGAPQRQGAPRVVGRWGAGSPAGSTSTGSGGDTPPVLALPSPSPSAPPLLHLRSPLLPLALPPRPRRLQQRQRRLWRRARGMRPQPLPLRLRPRPPPPLPVCCCLPGSGGAALPAPRGDSGCPSSIWRHAAPRRLGLGRPPCGWGPPDSGSAQQRAGRRAQVSQEGRAAQAARGGRARGQAQRGQRGVRRKRRRKQGPWWGCSEGPSATPTARCCAPRPLPSLPHSPRPLPPPPPPCRRRPLAR